MKKIISFIAIFALIFTFFLTGTAFAASLDTLNVEVNKTTVRPGEEVNLTINFGQNLGAYTFDIAYDNNIFDYVTADGGTTNNTGNKIRVTFYDTTGGTNPRQNMSIVFKAKEGITTSNPTELTVTGEGLANADASVTYDDITTPIVKNIIVEPEYKDYVLNLEYTGDIIFGEEKDMKLSYSSSMGRYYEHARLIATATTPKGANVKLIATESTTRAEQDIIQSGWGDPQGYKIGGKNVLQVLNTKALFTEAGDYTITLKLIDRDNADSVIAEKEFSFTVKENKGEIIPPVEEEPPKAPETNNGGTTNNGENTNNVQKPSTLPKTGENIYVPMAVILAILIAVAVYYNKKKTK